MISLLELNKAINDKVKNALANSEFDTVLIIASDLSEPIIRPSLKIFLEDSQNSLYNANCREKTLTVRVYFFASDLKKYKIENMKVQDLIETEFLTPLKIKEDFSVIVDEVESNVSDTVLICSFDIETVELLPKSITDTAGSDELMENLIIDIKEE